MKPPTDHKPDIRERTLDAVTALLDGDQLLIRLYMEGRTEHAHVAGESSHQKISGSPTPFGDRWSLLALEVEGAARRHHNRLTRLLWGGYRDRGSSHAAARGYLLAMPDLVAAAALDTDRRDTAHEVSRDVQRYARLAREALDEARADEQRPSRAPGNLSCPYCTQRLLLPAGWQHMSNPEVYCANPACRSEHGGRVSWPATAWLALVSAL